MSSSEQIQAIFAGIKTRVKGGTANYSTLLKLVVARADAEEKFGNMLKSIGAETGIDKDDALLSLFAESMRSDGDLRIRLANELRKGVADKLRNYGKTLEENKKKFLAMLNKDSSNISKACDEVDKAKKDLESEEKKLSQVPAVKRDSQQKKVDKAKQVVAAKVAVADKAAVDVQQTSMMSLHYGFSTYDAGRMTVMESAVKGYARIIRTNVKEADKNAEVLGTKMSIFDAAGRSARAVANIFGAKPGEAKIDTPRDEPPVCIAIADYRSDDENDLRFVRGDQITVLSEHSSGWWIGKVGNKTGTFPKTYVQTSWGSESPYRTEPIGAVFLVKWDHKGTRIGEIDLLSGDLVYLDYLGKDRCFGTNMRTNKRGSFPLETLELNLPEDQGHKVYEPKEQATKTVPAEAKKK